MSEVNQSVKYLPSHEWARQEGGLVVMGISDHAQSLLGDLVYIELPAVGKQVSKGDEVSVVESVKAASDVYAPVSGEVVEINKALESAPELVNGQPYGKGWICKIKPTNAAEFASLLSPADYQKEINA
jgi:glycine cleavage system H protein